jgi:hypothetical protein
MSHVCNAHLPNQILESTKPTYRAIMQSITHPVNNQLHDCTAARLEGVLRDAQLLAKAGAGVVRSNGRVGAGTVGSGKVRGRPATADLASLPLAGWPLVDPSAVSLTIGSSAAQRIPPPEQGRTSSATATDNNDGSAPSTSDRGHPDPDQVTRPPTGDSGLRADADIDSLALACGPPPVSRCCVFWLGSRAAAAPSPSAASAPLSLSLSSRTVPTCFASLQMMAAQGERRRHAERA